jgi:hypothetical protein
MMAAAQPDAVVQVTTADGAASTLKYKWSPDGRAITVVLPVAVNRGDYALTVDGFRAVNGVKQAAPTALVVRVQAPVAPAVILALACLFVLLCLVTVARLARSR